MLLRGAATVVAAAGVRPLDRLIGPVSVALVVVIAPAPVLRGGAAVRGTPTRD